jgi:hypothetical protein
VRVICWALGVGRYVGRRFASVYVLTLIFLNLMEVSH